MGACETFLNPKKDKQKANKQNEQFPKNKGSNLFCAPIDSATNNDNIYVNSKSMSQMTMDISHYQAQKPAIYKYINQYKTNGLQKSVAKASLVELGNGNSLMLSNMKNSKANQTINSIYTSKYDETGYESSYDGFEMIIDGKMDEELVKKSSDKNTINNYNEFIKKKEDDINNLNNKKIVDYYKKNKNINKFPEDNLDSIDINKDGDELSRIPSADISLIKKTNSNKNMKSKMKNYINSIGKY